MPFHGRAMNLIKKKKFSELLDPDYYDSKGEYLGTCWRNNCWNLVETYTVCDLTYSSDRWAELA
jgi:hypothetical protein